MRICIPTADNRGLKAAVHTQFGTAPFMTVVDQATRKATVVANTAARWGHGTCRVLKELDLGRVDAVVCPDIGRRAIGRLTEEGLQVFITEARTVSAILDGITAGTLKQTT